MNIGEKFYCSSCLAELSDEKICPFCGYDPAGKTDPDALEEGTLLNGMQYQLGAVRCRSENSIEYGAFDYVRQRTVFIKEFFPVRLAKRDCTESDTVTVRETDSALFEKRKKDFLASHKEYSEILEENGTVYVI